MVYNLNCHSEMTLVRSGLGFLDFYVVRELVRSDCKYRRILSWIHVCSYRAARTLSGVTHEDGAQSVIHKSKRARK